MSTHETDPLPIPELDHLPLGSLASHVRSLEIADVERLLEHERAHADRPQVTVMLRQRIDELRGGAEPSGGDPAAGANPEIAPAGTGDSPVQPGTQGPPVNPPSQGVPTNPAQPR